MNLLVFDFDGLIVDTESVVFETWNEIYRSYGAELPLAEWAVCIGTSHQAFDVYSYLESKLGKPLDRKEMAALHQRMMSERLEALEPRPGVLDYLEDARQMGIGLALASSSNRKWVMDHLNRLKLAEKFQCIRTGDDVNNVKPHPELYERALSDMGVTPEKAIAFEDSPNGIRAAQAAGIFCVAVPNGVTARLSLDHADFRMKSMADLTLRELLRRIETAKAKI
jgi:HAD superfamily hydrolase (TIGR01509 family)